MIYSPSIQTIAVEGELGGQRLDAWWGPISTSDDKSLFLSHPALGGA